MAASSENIVGETTKGINQPGPPELPTPIDTHTARDRALSIPHILKGVICGLSPWEIQDAEQALQADPPRTCHLPDHNVPCYPGTGGEQATERSRVLRALLFLPGKMSLHYRLRSRYRLLHEIEPCMSFVLNDAIDANLSDFVASPRCSAVSVAWYLGRGTTFSIHAHCTVYVPGGVKIRDLLEAASALKRGHVGITADPDVLERFVGMLVFDGGPDSQTEIAMGIPWYQRM